MVTPFPFAVRLFWAPPSAAVGCLGVLCSVVNLFVYEEVGSPAQLGGLPVWKGFRISGCMYGDYHI